MPGRHIFLTGFMGSGKSTVGKKLASVMNYPFVDLDARIEAESGLSVPEIFKLRGEQVFRQLESSVLSRVIDGQSSVVALGGGTVCHNQNISQLKKNGFTVYIKMTGKALLNRLQNSIHDRPLLAGTAPEELETKINALLAEREEFYRQADLTVDGINLDVSHLHKLILAAFP